MFYQILAGILIVLSGIALMIRGRRINSAHLTFYTVALVAAIFAYDIFAPLGSAVGLLYMMPVQTTRLEKDKNLVIAIGVTCVILILVGMVLSTTATAPLWIFAGNRGGSILGVSIVLYNAYNHSP